MYALGVGLFLQLLWVYALNLGSSRLTLGVLNAIMLATIAAGIVGDSFEGVPLAWGYAIFDAVMGLPMAGGAVLGGVLYRAGYALPFVLVIVVSAGLLVVLLASGRSPADGSSTDAGREGRHATH